MINKLVIRSALLLLSHFLLFAAEAHIKSAFITPLATKSLLTDIISVNGKMVAVGDRGHIILSLDGENWQQAQVPVNVLLTDVFFFDAHSGWAVGHDATILHSRDGGISWSIQQNLPKIDKPLFGVYFKDPLNGFAFGAYGLFYRTSDGGKRWQNEFHGELLHPDDMAYINEVKDSDPAAYEDETSSILPHFNRLAVVGQTLYLVGETGLVAKSDDFGHHWIKNQPFYNGSFFTVANTVKGLIAGGLRGNIFASNNGGASWQRLELDAVTSINRVFSAADDIVVVGNSGLLLSSHDGGKTFKLLAQSDGKAITGGIFLGKKLILTSEVGIKVIQDGQW